MPSHAKGPGSAPTFIAPSDTEVSPQPSLEDDPAQGDDIPDSPLPPAVALAVAPPPEPGAPVVQTLDALQALTALGQSAQKHLADITEQGKSVLRTVDSTWQVISRLCETVRQEGSPALPQLLGLLDELRSSGLRLESLGAPYEVTVQACAPGGYPIALTIRKPDAGQVIEALGNLLPWLQSQGYQPSESAVAQ